MLLNLQTVSSKGAALLRGGQSPARIRAGVDSNETFTMTSIENKAEALRDVLRGFGRGNQAALQRLSLFGDWQRIAAAELERRATKIVEVLDEVTLRAIAAGEVDFQKACRDVSDDLESKIV